MFNHLNWNYSKWKRSWARVSRQLTICCKSSGNTWLEYFSIVNPSSCDNRWRFAPTRFRTSWRSARRWLACRVLPWYWIRSSGFQKVKFSKLKIRISPTHLWNPRLTQSLFISVKFFKSISIESSTVPCSSSVFSFSLISLVWVSGKIDLVVCKR